MGLLSIVVSEEGLVELDFYDPKEDAPDLYGALEQVHPYHEKVKEWLDTILREIQSLSAFH